MCSVGFEPSVPKNVDSIATGYKLDGQRIESCLGRDFQKPFHTSPGAHPASCTMSTGSLPGVKWSGRGTDHPTPSSTKVKERVELHFYSPSGPSSPVLGRTSSQPSSGCVPIPQTAWPLESVSNNIAIGKYVITLYYITDLA